MEDKEEEAFFLELFRRVFESMSENQASSVQIIYAIEKFVAYFSKKGTAKACDLHNFSTLEDFLGYFYWSSPLSAGVTRKKTLFAIRDCNEFREQFQEESLNLVSVGGGTGSDLVGLYSALSEGIYNFQSMGITLIDNNIYWEQYQQAVKDNLSAECFGKASKLIREKKINTSFICADLRSMTNDYLSVLENANIVWMKGLLSILKSKVERSKIIQKIIEPMTPGALLVVFDSPFYVKCVDFKTKLKTVWHSNDKIYGKRYRLKFPYQEYKFARATKQQMFIYERIISFHD